MDNHPSTQSPERKVPPVVKPPDDTPSEPNDVRLSFLEATELPRVALRPADLLFKDSQQAFLPSSKSSSATEQAAATVTLAEPADDKPVFHEIPPTEHRDKAGPAQDQFQTEPLLAADLARPPAERYPEEHIHPGQADETPLDEAPIPPKELFLDRMSAPESAPEEGEEREFRFRRGPLLSRDSSRSGVTQRSTMKPGDNGPVAPRDFSSYAPPEPEWDAAESEMHSRPQRADRFSPDEAAAPLEESPLERVSALSDHPRENHEIDDLFRDGPLPSSDFERGPEGELPDELDFPGHPMADPTRPAQDMEGGLRDEFSRLKLWVTKRLPSAKGEGKASPRRSRVRRLLKVAAVAFVLFATPLGDWMADVASFGFGGLIEKAEARQAFRFVDDFAEGVGPQWDGKGLRADSSGAMRVSSLTLHRDTMNLVDYRMDFQVKMDGGAMGWVVRASDRDSYCAYSLVPSGSRSRRKYMLSRYLVIQGQRDEPQSVKIDVSQELDAEGPNQISVRVRGDRLNTFINGKGVDYWKSSEITRGGVGFWQARKGRSGLLRRVSVYGNEDFWGLTLYSALETLRIMGGWVDALKPPEAEADSPAGLDAIPAAEPSPESAT
jgi:hypothetical protein